MTLTGPFARYVSLTERARDLLQTAQPLAQWAARLYLAKVFFYSGLTKLRDWDITALLFTSEYMLPWLPPELAAFAGTGAELALPVLLVLGLGGRFAAFGLFVLNIVAALSLAELSAAGAQQHVFLGSLLLGLLLLGLLLWGLLLWGPGKWSLDQGLWRRLTASR